MERMTRQGYNGEYTNQRGHSCPHCRSNNRGACNSLMKELQKIDFALYETILYLDVYLPRGRGSYQLTDDKTQNNNAVFFYTAEWRYICGYMRKSFNSPLR